MAHSKESPVILLPQESRNIPAQLGVMLLMIAAVAAFIIYPILATGWLELPFIGAVVDNRLGFSPVSAAQRSVPWALRSAGMGEGDTLLALDGQTLASSADLDRLLKTYQPGETVSVTVRRADGTTLDLPVELIPFPSADRLIYAFLPYFVGIVFLISGFYTFARRRKASSGLAFTVFAVSVAVSVAGLFDTYTTHRLTVLWLITLPLASAGLLSMVIQLDLTNRILRKMPLIRFLPYVLALLMAGVNIVVGVNSARSARLAEYCFCGLCTLLAFLMTAVRLSKTVSPIERQQIRLFLLGGVFGFGPLTIWLLGSPFWSQESAFVPVLFVPMIIFPLVSMYAMQRYRVVNNEYVLSRSVLYSVLGVFAAVLYALLVSAMSLLVGGVVAPNNPLFAGLIFFLAALAFVPVRARLENRVDAVFFRGERAYQERIKTFSSALTRTTDLSGIVRVLREYVEQSLQPVRLHIFVYDQYAEQYQPVQDTNGQMTTDLRFSTTSALVTMMNRQRQPVFFSLQGEPTTALAPESARLRLLGAELFIPMPGRERISGFLALGRRLSGDPYSSFDFSFLESLCDQAMLAIERAQTVANLEKRVHEMNVLTRVGQGVNVTISLDDIYELTYAQISQIIPSDDFAIQLIEANGEALRRVFWVKQDERIKEGENVLLAVEEMLESAVMRARRALKVDEYDAACRERGIVKHEEGIFAWMGVPLNTGAETIGVLSLCQRTPAMVYTADQLNLIQAIADQAAGAIVKARLLSETQRRARQLSTLNEMTRQLTSTLELEPLLQNIIQSASDILNAEAGSLLLVDEATSELVFRVAVGPVAGELVNKRMPPGSGVVGRSFSNREAIIVNDVQTSNNWSRSPDQQTGFATHALLAVPLIVKDKPIGVVEVVNRRDGGGFTADDQELLSAFAAQASIAIDNARLYTLTDQALAERVEELSIMQRIDRELNTSLDVSRAMHITLEWAMRRSGATAGFVGMLYHEDSLRVMASQGYTTELAPYEQEPLLLTAFQLEGVITEGTPDRKLLPARAPRLLADARSRVIVPIQRESRSIGLIFLESILPDGCSDEALNFLMRLGDHASIAIANAQLYAAVQSANEAKSEFVSFVAHELKNPMTSIKGYTELLAAGAVGPVNEPQANFLATIRTNIERMNTLISDLNDLSKIEAGRLRLDYKAFNIMEVVTEVNRSTKRQIDDKQQKLNIQIPEDLPKVWADRIRVAQIVVNLVSNAHKYTEQGGEITFGAERSKNLWDEQGPAEVVHVWVKDSGIGITPEDQKKIFQKFFRSEDPKTREVPGTGLGLNITRSLVEMQNGKIWFESEFRKGTTFHFTIPIAE